LSGIGFVFAINDVHDTGFPRTIFGYEGNFLVFVDAERNVFKQRSFAKGF
jgi:hypothetical protein